MAGRELENSYLEATRLTAGDLLHTIAITGTTHLSQLELPEIERLTQEVARVVPAGNVPGMILNGLSRLDGRTVAPAESQKHIGLLFKGVRVALDKALYGTFFMGPAAILYGYQQILRLAGKDLDSAFPDGTWQFYLEFALREDTARHTNETTGFHNRLASLKLSESDQLAAWLTTIAQTVIGLPDILANEWRERMLLKVLVEVAETHRLRQTDELNRLYTTWEQQRPYGRLNLQTEYPLYRRQRFDQFIVPHLQNLRRGPREDFERQWQVLEAERLPAYQRQMSWLAYLHPDTFNETRVPYRLDEALIGVVWQGRYYLLPLTPHADPQTARKTAAAILSAVPSHPPATLDHVLVSSSREYQMTLRNQLGPEDQADLHRLRYVTAIVNWDEQNSHQSLAQVRQTSRGIGDHPLTIIRTDRSMAFDQSHIFFDGAWGAAVAQIMTGESVLQAESMAQSPAGRTGKSLTLYTPALQASAKITTAARKVPIVPEVSAENTLIRLPLIQMLRSALQQRSQQAHITVNDLLILYRGMHALLYEPSPRLREMLNQLNNDRRAAAQKAAQAVKEALERDRGKNPAILIPIDASRHDPRERVFPTTFWNPLTEFVKIHQDTLQALRSYHITPNRGNFSTFEKQRGEYLRMIAGFGELLGRYKDIARSGQSPSILSIKALAHLSPVIQQWFTSLPGKFDVMNEVIKGEEVFSNVGRVASGSTLRRFITAKDDNRQKTLCWGVLTDTQGTVHLSLRDFRPHVQVLTEVRLTSLAQLVVQDYLDAYAEGFNRYVQELNDITVARAR